jgi:hypothetical protein
MPVTVATRLAPEFIASLREPHQAVKPGFLHDYLEAFATLEPRDEILRQGRIPESSISAAAHRCGLDGDPAFVELYALSYLAIEYAKGSSVVGRDEALQLRQVITARVHALLETNPHLLSPHLYVAESDAKDGVLGLFERLATSCVAFDPARMSALGPVALGAISSRTRQVLANVIYTSILQGTLSNVTMLLRAGVPADHVDSELMDDIVFKLASHATDAPALYYEAAEMLRELKARQPTGTGLRDTRVPVEDPRGRPTLNFAYGVVIGANRNTPVVVDGFTGRIFTEMAELLNDVLATECRLSLAGLSSAELLRSVAIPPRERGNIGLDAFWGEVNHSSSSGLEPEVRQANSPMDILDWVVDVPHGPSNALLTVEELDEVDGATGALSADIGANTVARLRSRVVAREMRDVIGGALARGAAHSTGDAVAAAPDRRRRLGV